MKSEEKEEEEEDDEEKKEGLSVNIVIVEVGNEELLEDTK